MAHVLSFRFRDKTRAKLCPGTQDGCHAGIDSKSPNRWFSILAPGAHIPPHKGVTKGIVTCHMGLIVPKDRENCRLRVEDE
ncbi:MAG: hypothetical protein HKP56_20690 [Anderseniella sp.]|nr:hypothetical protein [Anderseniella sp.]